MNKDLLKKASEIDQKLMNSKSRETQMLWEAHMNDVFDQDLNSKGEKRQYLADLTETELNDMIETGETFLKEE